MLDLQDDLTAHVTKLAQAHATWATDISVPRIKHNTMDRHYPGVECYSMGERSFGRALAMLENLMAEDGRPVLIALRFIELSDGEWDCFTPNRDESESHHRIIAREGKPWEVYKVEHGAGSIEHLVPTPYSVWANLDAAPRFEPNGNFANLAGWNVIRQKNGSKPMVSGPADDKHIMLLALALRVKFNLYTTNGQINEYTLKEIIYGYRHERLDWLSADELRAETGEIPMDTPSGNPLADLFAGFNTTTPADDAFAGAFRP